MKKNIIILFGLFVSLEIFAQLGYRCEGKFIELKPSTTERYYIQTRNSESKQYLERIADKEHHQNKNPQSVYMISENSFFVSSKSNMLENDYISELFYDSKGNPIFVAPRIILALKDNAHIEDVIKGYTEILTLDSNQMLKGMLTLTCNLSSAQDVLKVVAELDTYDEVKWCEPDMISKCRPHDNNPLFSMQYYLQNNNSGQYDINVVPAWEITTGNENITVAVIDEGVEPDHEDLSGSVLQGLTIGSVNNYGAPLNENLFTYKGHGVVCAGIIGARDNEKGILGVAYGVKILPVNVAPYVAQGDTLSGISLDYGWTLFDSEMAYAIQWAAERADVLNLSWGYSNDHNCIISAINNAMTNGRNGKGCIVVAASGDYYSNTTTIDFPARMEGVIAVGAIKKDGSIQDYCQRGSDLDLVAPSGLPEMQGDVVTTDRMLDFGYNPYRVPSGPDLSDHNYTQKFGGTSASCAEVSGVAALLLSLQPNLTNSEVRNILFSTAHDLGATGKDNTFGYGLVDAYAALKVANSSISGKTVLCDTANYVITGLPSSYTINWSINNSYFSINPSGNQCFVTYIGTPQYNVANLSATISWNGTTIKTLTKRIAMHGTDLVVYGEQDSYVSPNGIFPYRQFTIPANNGLRMMPNSLNKEELTSKESLPIKFIEDNTRDLIHPPVDLCGYGITEINGGNMVYLSSDRFEGMDIWFSGYYSPTYLYHSENSCYVSFQMPYYPTEYPVTLHAESDGGCHDFCLTFKVVPLPGASSGDDEIWVNLDGSMLYVNFLPVGNMSSYSVTISKIPAGTQVYSNTFPGTQSYFSVNTSSWTSGIYSIRIVQGNNIYTKSIYI
jgi:subtilisin family serine protease